MRCGTLCFCVIPSGHRRNETVRLISIELSGIQKYIFGAIGIHTSAQEISERSAFIVHITDEIEKHLQNIFGKTLWVLNKSSGKLLCALPRRVKEPRINEALTKLQRSVYASTHGELEPYYAHCIARITDRPSDFDAREELSAQLIKNKYHCTNLLKTDFIREFDTSFSLSVQKNRAQYAAEQHDPALWVAVKFDLDNLGAFFHEIPFLDQQQKASEALDCVLHDALSRITNAYPVFVGGDDLFVLVQMETYLQDIWQIYSAIRDGIDGQPALERYRPVFSVCCGAALMRTDLGEVPLYYAYQNSEEELIKAKKTPGKNVISVLGDILRWNQLALLAEITQRQRYDLFGLMTPNQKMVLLSHVRELIGKLLQWNRATRGKYLSQEEERRLREIG